MEDKTGLLEKYIEEGKLPLTGEKFIRKAKIAGKLELQREEIHRIALSRRRKRDGYKSVFLYRGVAAAFVILLGVSAYYLSAKKVIAEATAVDYELPDGSKVKLMANSTLAYNRIGWFWERKLQLFGRALFNVTSGETFTVRTEAGNVTVLGTKFLVAQQGKKMLVNCEEGSVQVATPVGQQTLTAGQSVRCDESKIVPVKRKVPTPESEFPEILEYEDDPLVNVVADMEQIFKVKVIGREKCEGMIYSGAILTKDLNATLEKVFGSCGIGYQLRGKEVILQ
jgi:Fe2+-dicitrate sensor, membrane component